MSKHIYNMVSIINNGQSVKKPFVLQLKKKSCEKILNVLWDEGFILGYKIQKKNPNFIKIFLKYQKGVPSISKFKMLSKPSLRVYYSAKQLWKLKDGDGLLILSTNKGFMTSSSCKKYILGGEPFITIK